MIFYQFYLLTAALAEDEFDSHLHKSDSLFQLADIQRRESVDRGLRQFALLINNKTFILTFIRTLEANKNFTMRDRVNVASLISVALQTQMEYATE